LLLHLLPLIQLLHLDLQDYLVVVILAVNYQFQQYHICSLLLQILQVDLLHMHPAESSPPPPPVEVIVENIEFDFQIHQVLLSAGDGFPAPPPPIVIG
jgi:hypothetical protein